MRQSSDIPEYVKVTLAMIAWMFIYLVWIAMIAHTWNLGNSSSASVVEMYVIRFISAGTFIGVTSFSVFAMRVMYIEARESWRNR